MNKGSERDFIKLSGQIAPIRQGTSVNGNAILASLMNAVLHLNWSRSPASPRLDITLVPESAAKNFYLIFVLVLANCMQWIPPTYPSLAA